MAKPLRTISASEFKAKCLKLMDEVAETGEGLVITKNGRPTAKLSPATRRKTPKRKPLFGFYRNQMGDLSGMDFTKPVVDAAVWTADAGNVLGRRSK